MTTQPTWLLKSEYPFESNYFDHQGVKQHYIDVGKGETLVFVHGTPSWSFDFRNVIKVLALSYRCIAIDHIGFGLSAKPADFDYSPQAHAQRLEAFISHKKLTDLTLVLHDFGGPIGLAYALRHPANVKRIVILNSWIGSSKDDPEFIRFTRLLKSPLLPFLYLYLNFSPRFLLPASFGSKKLPAYLRSQFTKPFASVSQRYGTLAFAHALLNDQEWFEYLWSNRQLLGDVSCLFIWGLKDRFITEKYLDKFKNGFSNHKTFLLSHAGHFPQEEEPDKVAAVIFDFCKS
mgnify:CR=1 FL=1